MHTRQISRRRNAHNKVSWLYEIPQVLSSSFEIYEVGNKLFGTNIAFPRLTISTETYADSPTAVTMSLYKRYSLIRFVVLGGCLLKVDIKFIGSSAFDKL
jgi:hypothetical protein